MDKKETVTVWVPKGFTPKKVLNVLFAYGIWNNTLAGEKYDENVVPYRIVVSVEKVKEKDA